MQPGDDIVITTTLEHEAGIDDWVCAVQIDNVRGQAVWGTTTRRVGFDLDPLKGERTLTLTVTDAMFAGGKYFVNVSLMDFAGRHLHDLPQATSFNVAEQADAAGSMYARPASPSSPDDGGSDRFVRNARSAPACARPSHGRHLRPGARAIPAGSGAGGARSRSVPIVMTHWARPERASET